MAQHQQLLMYTVSCPRTTPVVVSRELEFQVQLTHRIRTKDVYRSAPQSLQYNTDMQVPTSASIGVPFPEFGELCAGLYAIAVDKFLAGSVPAEAGLGSSSFMLFWL